MEIVLHVVTPATMNKEVKGSGPVGARRVRDRRDRVARAAGDGGDSQSIGEPARDVEDKPRWQLVECEARRCRRRHRASQQVGRRVLDRRCRAACGPVRRERLALHHADRAAVRGDRDREGRQADRDADRRRQERERQGAAVARAQAGSADRLRDCVSGSRELRGRAHEGA